MKLLQLNIWNGRLLPKVINLIASEQPDIVCMQEVFHGPEVVTILEQQFNNLRALQGASDLEHSFFAPSAGILIGDKHVDMGNAILSRFPLRNQRTIFTAGEYQTSLDATQKFPNIRNLQLTKIELDGKSLTIANHHGYWLPQPLGDENTVQSFQAVADALRDIQGPLILAGDMNVIPKSPAMRVFDDFLEDLTATHGLKTTLSELGKAIDVPCDHILVSPDINIRNFYAPDELVSDHKALILEFEL